MRSLINKIFFRSNNLDNISQNIKDLTINTPSNKIFKAINSYSSESEIRYVGGCIRKIINKEEVDDIDLATNLEPKQVCEALKKNKIRYYESGIEHGTVTAIEDNYTFEITTLRKDIFTDGRHAKVEFSKDWKTDASRRDFTINSIYSDKDGNLFDPFNGKQDLENGIVNFIGEADKRIKEDYLRILRYLRFFLNYSKQQHTSENVRKLKININGILKLSKERLLDELKKITKVEILEKLSKDKISLEIFLIIFPELKNIKFFSKLNSIQKDLLKEKDFIFLLSLMIIDETDNTDYFLYKFNSKSLKKNNMDEIFYYEGKEVILDILNYKMIKSKKIDNSLKQSINYYEKKITPIMPVNADFLMKKFKISEGKQLGDKLRIIENYWVKNNFKISDEDVDNIVNS